MRCTMKERTQMVIEFASMLQHRYIVLPRGNTFTETRCINRGTHAAITKNKNCVLFISMQIERVQESAGIANTG